MIVAGFSTGVGFLILKESRTRIRIQKFWNRSGVPPQSEKVTTATSGLHIRVVPDPDFWSPIGQD